MTPRFESRSRKSSGSRRPYRRSSEDGGFRSNRGRREDGRSELGRQSFNNSNQKKSSGSRSKDVKEGNSYLTRSNKRDNLKKDSLNNASKDQFGNSQGSSYSRMTIRNSNKKDNPRSTFERQRSFGKPNYSAITSYSGSTVNNQLRPKNDLRGENIPIEQGPPTKELPNDFLCGRHASQSALESGRPIHRVWCTAELRSSPRFLQLLREAKASGVLVEEVSWARLGQLTGGAVHQGITLQIAAAETLSLNNLIEGCNALKEAPLLIALDGLKDPQNLGAIVRSAEALGAHGLVIPQRRNAGLTASVAKVAVGALEHLPVARVVNLNRSLEQLKQEGYRVIGLAAEGDETLADVDLSGPLVVVTGSEDKGISLLTRRNCDVLVRIPLRGVTTSLNASVATSLVLYEVARRSWMKGLSGQAPSPKMLRVKCSADLTSDEKTEIVEISNISSKALKEKPNQSEDYSFHD